MARAVGRVGVSPGSRAAAGRRTARWRRAAVVVVTAGAAVPLAGVLAGGVGAGAAAGSSPAGARGRVGRSGALVAVGAAARPLAGERPAGRLAASSALSLGVALRPRDPAGLANYAAAVSDPASPSYHHYLRPAQFAARFGATRSTIAALAATLRRDGLSVGKASGNGLLVPVTGTAGRVESAFHTGLTRFAAVGRGPTWGADTAPRLPAAIAGQVAGVLGLDNLASPHSFLEHAPTPAQRAALGGRVPGGSGTATPTTATPMTATPTTATIVTTTGPTRGAQSVAAAKKPAPSGPSVTHAPTAAPVACGAAQRAAASGGGWTDQQLASAYGLTGLYAKGDVGAGQTIALYELEPYSASDLAAFDQCYFGRNRTSQVTAVPLDGFALAGPGSGESLLDIEDVSALAPAAHLLVYEAPNTTFGGIDAFNAIVSQDRASIVSTSWGECEAALQIGAPQAQQIENTLFEEAAAQGQTVFAASGDTGSDDCASTPFGSTSPAAPYLSVDDPASQPYVVGVGGTTMTSASNPPHQTVWNDGASWGGSGGGISSTWTTPPWQADSGVPGVRTSGGRQVPDVSASADEWRGITVYSSSFAASSSGTGGPAPGGPLPAPPAGWTTIGGTSSAAPTWAAVAAEIAASPSCATVSAGAGSSHDLGFVGPELYQVAGNPVAYASSFTQVRAGTNDVYGLGLGYPAGPGYNLATGLGTPTVTDAGGQGGLAASLCAVAGATAPAGGAGSPSVTALSPSAGPLTGGTTVQVTGSGYPTGDPSAVQVLFGTTPATVVSVPSPTTLVVTSPALTTSAGAASFAVAGPVQVTVTVAGATSRPGPASVFQAFQPAPSPSGGAPSGPGTGAGQGTGTGPVTAVPTVSGIGPSVVNASGGATVTVYGSGYSAADTPTVTVGGVPATGVTVVSSDELHAVVPPKGPSTSCATGAGFAPSTACQVEVVVRDSAGSSPTAPILPTVTGPVVFDAKGVVEPTPETEVAPAATELDYAPTPLITSVSPDPGDASGQTPVVITGSGFSFNTLDWVNFGPSGTVQSEQVDISSITPTQIVIVPPPAPSAGTAAAQSLAGGISVQSGGGLSNVYPFSYAGVPTVSSLTTFGGPTTGGTRLTLKGSNLSDASVVEFVSQVGGGAYGASATVAETARTSTSITVTTPADLPGPVDVVACTASACAHANPAHDTFVYFSPTAPAVSLVTPRVGPAQGGTTVTLFGNNLNGAVAVRFGTNESSAIAQVPGYPDGDPYVLEVHAAAGPAGQAVPVSVVGRNGRSVPVPAMSFRYETSAPSAPRALSVQLVGSAAHVRWAQPLSDGGRPISGYRVLALAAGAPPVAVAVAAGQRSATLRGLEAHHLYDVRVAAVSTVGRGLWAESGPRAVAYAANGYRVATTGGVVQGFGSLGALGGVAGSATSPVVAVAPTGDGLGYWLVERNGTVAAFGDATPLGYPRSATPMVGIAADPAGSAGYWLVDAAGHVDAYGSAPRLGSLSGKLARTSPAVGIAAAGTHGYWVVQADGTVTPFGSAGRFAGTGRPVAGGAVAIAALGSGHGYFVLSADGAVHAFGSALVLGSTGGTAVHAGAVAIAPTPTGRGYWVASGSGAVGAYGDATYEGRPSLPAGAVLAGIAAA